MTTQQTLSAAGQTLAAHKLNNVNDGIPVILLHGVTLSINVWLTDVAFSDYTAGPCYALSLPGHYPAAFPATFSESLLTPEMFAEVLTEGIRQLVGEQRVILVGHSTGGFCALTLAAYNPTLAHAVISLAGFAQGRWIGFYGFSQWLARQGAIGRGLFKFNFQTVGLHPTLYRQAWRLVVYDTKVYFAYPKLDRLIADCYLYNKQLDLTAVSYYFRQMPDIDITPMLPNITAPTLAVAGDKDGVVPPTQAELIAQHVPNGELAIIKETGHMMFVENPSEYARLLKDWLPKVA